MVWTAWDESLRVFNERPANLVYSAQRGSQNAVHLAADRAMGPRAVAVPPNICDFNLTHVTHADRH